MKPIICISLRRQRLCSTRRPTSHALPRTGNWLLPDGSASKPRCAISIDASKPIHSIPHRAAAMLLGKRCVLMWMFCGRGAASHPCALGSGAVRSFAPRLGVQRYTGNVLDERCGEAGCAHTPHDGRALKSGLYPAIPSRAAFSQRSLSPIPPIMPVTNTDSLPPEIREGATARRAPRIERDREGMTHGFRDAACRTF